MRRSTTLVAASIAASCLTVGPAANATETTPPAKWGTCPADVLASVPPAQQGKFSCATEDVPIDYRDPAAGTIGVAMLRRAADDQAHRIGSLLLNPGGPGGHGFELPIQIEGVAPAEVLRRFDVIGFDPRGVGRSAPLRCFTSQEQASAVADRIVSEPVSRAEITDVLGAAREYTEDCAANAGPLLSHMSTMDVARDLDRLRESVGDPRLNYLGFSYGTLLGATYANLFPSKVRAVVLDGNVDPRLRTTNGLEYMRQRAAGQEDVINSFLRLCSDVGPKCAFGSGDPRAKFAEIRERLRQGPVTVPSLGTVTLSAFANEVSGSMYAPAQYAPLASALQVLYDVIHSGTQPKVARVFSPTFNGLLDTPYTGDDSSIAVNCSDEPFPPTQVVFPLVADVWERQSPTVGRAHAFSEVPCATWPVPPVDRYSGPWNRPTASPVLLFGNLHDPATNYTFNTRMAAELGSARLVTVNAFGHTILGPTGHSECALGIVTRYLVDSVVPPAGTVCQAELQPFQ